MKTKYLLFAIALTFLVTLTHTSCSADDGLDMNEDNVEDLDKGETGGNGGTGTVGGKSVKALSIDSVKNTYHEAENISNATIKPE